MQTPESSSSSSAGGVTKPCHPPSPRRVGLLPCWGAGLASPHWITLVLSFAFSSIDLPPGHQDPSKTYEYI